MTSKDLANVRAQVETLRWIKQRKAELKELEADARGAVEEVMGESDEGMLDGELVVTWRRYKKRSLDQSALKNAHPNVHEEHMKISEVRKFEIIDE